MRTPMRTPTGTMTTLLPDRAIARRTRLSVMAAPGRPQVRSSTSGDPAGPCMRAMLLESGPGRATVALVPDGALLLAGDAVGLDVEVGPGVRLDLVEPAGTVAYDMRGGKAVWDVHLDLAADATLVWAGEPFVLSAGARVLRSTSVRLGERARLALRETLVLGRHQERIGELEQTWTASGPDGKELLVEQLCLDESAHRPGILGGLRVLGSLVALGLDVRADVCGDGRMDLQAGGVVWRRLAGDAHRAVPEDAWRAVLDAC